MVDLTDAGSPFQQSIPNIAFYVPAVVVFGLAGKCIILNNEGGGWDCSALRHA